MWFVAPTCFINALSDHQEVEASFSITFPIPKIRDNNLGEAGEQKDTKTSLDKGYWEGISLRYSLD